MVSARKRIGVFLKILNLSIKGVESPLAPFCILIDYLVWVLSKKRIELRTKINTRMNIKKYKRDTCYDINGIKLPLLDLKNENSLFSIIYYETFVPYVFWGNRFSERNWEDYMARTNYGLEKTDFKVVVEPGDVVFDLGSWIGDFAAYASKCESTVYAFEPTPDTYKILCDTAKLNPGIIPVNSGIGATIGELSLAIEDENITGISNTFNQNLSGDRPNFFAKIDTIDNFIMENNIAKVDFIKADIEGFEREMLKGAAFTLKNHAPKLAISTYHLQDDPEVLEKLVRDANPNYRIVHKGWILFARV
jgi:FkbM family methyltransferase